MAVEALVGVGFAVARLLTRVLQDQDVTAALFGDTGDATSKTTALVRELTGRSDPLTKTITARLQAQLNPTLTDDHAAAVNEAAAEVTALFSSDLADDAAVRAAATHPDDFRAYAMAHGGSRRKARVEEGAEGAFDRILDAACEQFASLVPGSPRFAPAALTELLRQAAALGADLAHNTAVTEQIHEVVTRLASAPAPDVAPGRVTVGIAPLEASSFQVRPALADQLTGADGAVVVLRQVLAGGGGVGKTQLAAHHFRDSTAPVRLWVTAGDRSAVLTAYARAATKLHLGVGGSDVEGDAQLFLEHLEDHDPECLVVLDDLNDPTVISGWWPTGQQTRTLVTTRHRDAAVTGHGRVLVDVDVYTAGESAGYLTGRLGHLPPDVLAEAAGLAEDLGHHPLGLAQAAAVIINQGLTCAAYRARFHDRQRSLTDLFPATADTDGYLRTITTTWQLAIDAANQLHPTGLAGRVAELISLLDPNGVPQTVPLAGAAKTCLNKGAESEADSHTVTADDIKIAVRNLHQLSVITHDPDADNPRNIRMHQLTARALQTTLGPPVEEHLVRAAADALVEVWPSHGRQPLLATVLRANAMILTYDHPEPLKGTGTGAHHLCFRIGQSLREVGLPTEAYDYFDHLAADLVIRLGPNHPDTLSSRNNLAGAYQSAGDLTRAIPLYEQTLADVERVLGPDHPNTLTSRNNLGYAYQSAGDLTRAIPLYEQTLTDTERVLGPDHPDTLISRNNLAGAYQSAGDMDRAIPLFEQTLTDAERVLGPDHPDTLISRNNLAGAYRLANDLTRAIPLGEQTLTDIERVLGPDHPNTLISRNNLAGAYQSAGHLTRAIPLFEQTLTDRLRVLGPDHPDTLISRNNLVGAYQSAGDLDRAIPLYEQILTDRLRVLGPDHPDTLISRSNLASAYRSIGDLDRAILLYEQTLTAIERVLGPDHPSVT